MFIIMEQGEDNVMQYSCISAEKNMVDALGEYTSDNGHRLLKGFGNVFETLYGNEFYYVIILEASANDYVMATNNYPISIIAPWISSLQDRAKQAVKEYYAVRV